MILISQDQFRDDFIRPLYKGEQVALPAGYAEKYEIWKQANINIINTLSPEDITKSFALFLEESIKEDIKKLLDPQDLDSQKLAVRGQVLLASKDSKNFDQLITPAKAAELNPTEYQILSPSLRTSTNDLKEVLDEQLLLHTVRNLMDSGYFLDGASLDAGLINIDVRASSNGSKYTVQVDPNQKADQPMAYTFIDDKGQKSVVFESQLPQKYGEIKAKDASEVSPLALGAAGAFLGLDALNKGNASMLGMGTGDMGKPFLPQNRMTPQINVMDAKKRLEREKTGEKLQFERREKREHEIEEHNEKARVEKIKAEEKRMHMPQKTKGGMSGKTAGAIVAGAASAAVMAPIVTAITTAVIL